MRYKTAQEFKEERELMTIKLIVATLANVCCGSTDKIIDLLTGYLWTEEEAEKIKQ